MVPPFSTLPPSSGKTNDRKATRLSLIVFLGWFSTISDFQPNFFCGHYLIKSICFTYWIEITILKYQTLESAFEEVVSAEFYQKPLISEKCTKDLSTPLSAFESFIEPALTLLLENSNIEMEKLKIKKYYNRYNPAKPKNIEKAM